MLFNIYLTFALVLQNFVYSGSKLKTGNILIINLKTSIEYGRVNFYTEISIPPATLTELDVNLADQRTGFSVLQLHSFQYNVTLSFNRTLNYQMHQNGTNLGVVLRSRAKVFVHNFNYHTDVTAAVVVIVYDRNAPMPGGCNLEHNIKETPTLSVQSASNLIKVDTPTAAASVKIDPEQIFCNRYNNNMSYEYYYRYLPKGDFSARTYFENIKMMLETDLVRKYGKKALKSTPRGAIYRRCYVATPGTGIVFNTIVHDRKGVPAAYVPALSYSCIPPFWENRCTIVAETNDVKIFAIVLIIYGLLRTSIFFDSPIIDLSINSIPIGSYIMYRILSTLEISLEKDLEICVIITIGLLFSVLICVIASLWGITRITLDIVLKFLFGFIVASCTMFTLEDFEFFANNNMYWIIFSILTGTFMFIMIPTFRIITIILQTFIASFSFTFGLLMLNQSNMLLILLNHFHRIGVKNFNTANGTPFPDKSDIYIFNIGFLLLLIGTLLQYKRIFACARNENGSNGLESENTPIITRWTTGSDEVFESPNSNYRFFRRLAVRQRHLSNN